MLLLQIDLLESLLALSLLICCLSLSPSLRGLAGWWTEHPLTGALLSEMRRDEGEELGEGRGGGFTSLWWLQPGETRFWTGVCVCVRVQWRHIFVCVCVCVHKHTCARHICNWLLPLPPPCSQLGLWSCGNLGSAWQIRPLISTQSPRSGISTCALLWRLESHRTRDLIAQEIP